MFRLKYAIVSKKDNKSYMVEMKIRETLDTARWIYDKKDPTLVICVGGDGTLLYAVHLYMDTLHKVEFLGIHTGTLGFFTDYTEAELDECLYDVLHNTSSISESDLLEIQVDNSKNKLYALNEMRIENIEKSQVTDIYIDGVIFECCHGSGLCLSTQAGSTAYNRSLHGAVIDSGLSLLQLTEITPIQHSKHRSLGNPYILDSNRVITFQSDCFDTAYLCYDHLNTPLINVSRIDCRLSDKKVRFARYREYSYLKRLKNLY